jgi:hypothetical protein
LMHTMSSELLLMMTSFSIHTILAQGPWVMSLSAPRMMSLGSSHLSCLLREHHPPTFPWLHHQFLCYYVLWMKRQFKVLECSSVSEYLPSLCEVLGLIFSTSNKKTI